MKLTLILLTLCILAAIKFAHAQTCAGPEFSPGSGHFAIEGGSNRENRCIEIYYHVPQGVSSDSPVVIVVPGAGRNGWDYRDAWVEASEKYDVVVLSPSFSEEHYPRFWSYNLGGMISDVEISGSPRRISDYKINLNPEAWIFSDLDRIFHGTKKQLGLHASRYDAFGHSAGGQFLHRMAIFHVENKARRIIAANSGWYTVPVLDDRFPYGLEGSSATRESIVHAFKAPLVVYLGELDDKNETRGDLASSPEIDVQGPGRIERGRYFYSQSLKTAESIGAKVEWEMVVVPGVGHDYRRMSKAASEYLYDAE